MFPKLFALLLILCSFMQNLAAQEEYTTEDYQMTLVLAGNCDPSKCFSCYPCVVDPTDTSCPNWCDSDCSGCPIVHQPPEGCAHEQLSNVDQKEWAWVNVFSNSDLECDFNDVLDVESGIIGIDYLGRNDLIEYLCVCDYALYIPDEFRCIPAINELFYLASQCPQNIISHANQNHGHFLYEHIHNEEHDHDDQSAEHPNESDEENLPNTHGWLNSVITSYTDIFSEEQCEEGFQTDLMFKLCEGSADCTLGHNFCGVGMCDETTKTCEMEIDLDHGTPQSRWQYMEFFMLFTTFSIVMFQYCW